MKSATEKYWGIWDDKTDKPDLGDQGKFLNAKEQELDSQGEVASGIRRVTAEYSSQTATSTKALRWERSLVPFRKIRGC